MSEEGTLKISKTMLIIKSDMGSLKGVEQFLKNREWFLKSTNQLKEAVLFLVQHKPSFVLVSIDHPNKKMRNLPKILASAFPCCVMVYAEKPTTAAFKALLDSGAEYKINPPITGPAIERAVNKYIRDQEQMARQKDPNHVGPNGEKGNFDFQIEVKSGQGDKAAGFVSMTAESGQSGDGAAGMIEGSNSAQNSFAQNLLAQLGLGSSDDDSGQMPGVIQSGKSDPATAAAFANALQSEIASQNGNSGSGGKPGSLPLSGKLDGKGSTNTPGSIGSLGSSGSREGQVINLPLSRDKNPSDQPGTLQGRKNGPGAQSEYADGDGSQAGSLGGGFSKKKKANGELDSEDSESDESGSLGLGGKNKKKKKNEAGHANDNDESGEPDVLIGRARTIPKSNAADSEDVEGAKELYVPTGDKKKNENRTPEEQARARQDIILGRNADDVKNGRGSQNDDATARHKIRDSGQLKIRNSAEVDADSLLIKGVVKTIDESVDKNPSTVQEKLEDNTHLACIIVESPRFSGYLVAALGKDKKIDDAFVELVRTRLMKFLKDNGEQIDHDQNMQIKVKRVDFEGWALEYAQFLKKSVHKGDEVAMAFFPFADAHTQVGESAHNSMVSVKTSEIQTNVPLEFNLYIYLPTNKKYILYTPEQGKFLPEQKSRLVRQGVQSLHIRRDDVQNLSKFKAQNHLNSLIDHFDDQNKAKKKVS